MKEDLLEARRSLRPDEAGTEDEGILQENGIYILDLGKTVKLFNTAEQFVSRLAAEGRTILFVGTKRQAKDVIAEEAERCGMFHVNERWLGGLLTNFATIQRSLGRLRDLEAMATDGRFDTLSKKEIARHETERAREESDGIRGCHAARRSSSST
jgi:small subunit ribosomal protein S2